MPASPSPPSFLEKLLRAKAFIFTLIILPGLWPAVPLIRQNQSILADPLKYLLHHFGFIACVLLAVVLALSPLRVVFPRSRLANVLNRHRRLIGVSVFIYALLHLTAHVIYEGGFATFAEDIKRPFLLTGMIAFVILFTLAATSLDRVIRAMGAKNWKWLHRLAYLAAGLAAYHQAAARKVFPLQVLWIFIPLALLELARIATLYRSRSSTAARH
jgi:methionine sulfoxide reductase heme-binding subunit